MATVPLIPRLYRFPRLPRLLCPHLYPGDEARRILLDYLHQIKYLLSPLDFTRCLQQAQPNLVWPDMSTQQHVDTSSVSSGKVLQGSPLPRTPSPTPGVVLAQGSPMQISPKSVPVPLRPSMSKDAIIASLETEVHDLKATVKALQSALEKAESALEEAKKDKEEAKKDKEAFRSIIANLKRPDPDAQHSASSSSSFLHMSRSGASLESATGGGGPAGPAAGH